MPAAVVHRLQPVEVDHQDRHRGAPAVCLGQHLGEALAHRPPVGKPGERVGRGLTPQPADDVVDVLDQLRFQLGGRLVGGLHAAGHGLDDLLGDPGQVGHRHPEPARDALAAPRSLPAHHPYLQSGDLCES